MLYKQFDEWRRDTWKDISEMRSYHERMHQAEAITAMTFPVYETRYSSDPKNPLRLYDSLQPTLREQVPRLTYHNGDEASYGKDIGLML